MVLMKKPIKFKDNICSVKQYAQIIFETKNIKNEDDFLYGMVPKNWKIQRTIFEGKKVNAYYNGKLSKGKNEGMGTQIILEDEGWGIVVVSYYKGNWENGKKKGKGIWCNVHPLIGTVNTIGDGFGKTSYAIDYEHPAIYYNGNWLNDKKHGKGEEGDIYPSPYPEIVCVNKGIWENNKFIK